MSSGGDAGQEHVTACDVRWLDIDVYGHANNTAYLRYLEEARIRMLRAGGTRWAVEGFVIASIDVRYLHPLRFRTEPITVASTVTRIGTSSYRLAQHVRDEGSGTVHARAGSALVAIDLVSRRSRPLTEPERDHLRRFAERQD